MSYPSSPVDAQYRITRQDGHEVPFIGIDGGQPNTCISEKTRQRHGIHVQILEPVLQPRPHEGAVMGFGDKDIGL